MPASKTTFPGFTAQDESDTVGLSSMDKSAPFLAHGSETAAEFPPAAKTEMETHITRMLIFFIFKIPSYNYLLYYNRAKIHTVKNHAELAGKSRCSAAFLGRVNRRRGIYLDKRQKKEGYKWI